MLNGEIELFTFGAHGHGRRADVKQPCQCWTQGLSYLNDEQGWRTSPSGGARSGSAIAIEAEPEREVKHPEVVVQQNLESHSRRMLADVTE